MWLQVFTARLVFIVIFEVSYKVHIFWEGHKILRSLPLTFDWHYSSVPNRRIGPNKRAGGKIHKKTLNVQDRIDVQGGKILENQ